MNKIISINLCGIIFQIDESAYETIKNYLQAIKHQLGQTEGSYEIYQDIETRVAELFQFKIASGKQAILPTDVAEVQALIGKPESFKDWSDAPRPSTEEAQAKSIRRIYRNVDDRVLGGVCSGLAHYLGVDPLVIRLAYAGLIFIFGIGILFYLILWIVIPAARTMEQKMQMMGKNFGFGPLNTSLKNEAKAVGDNFKQMAGEFRNVAPSMKGIGGSIGKLTLRIFALIVILIGTIIFLPIAIGILAIVLAFGVTLPIVGSMIFVEAGHGVLAFLGALFFFFLPLTWIIFKFVQMLFKTKPLNRTVKMSFLVLWVLGLGMLAFVLAKLINDFSHQATKTELVTLKVPTERMLVIKSAYKEFDNVSFGLHNINFTYHGNNAQHLMDTFALEQTSLMLVPSTDSLVHLKINKVASGENQATASKRSEAMTYDFYQNDSTIILPPKFTFVGNQVWRNQHVRLTLQVPVGRIIKFDNTVNDDFLDEHSFRLNNDDERDLLLNNWQMTEHGLVPIN